MGGNRLQKTMSKKDNIQNKVAARASSPMTCSTRRYERVNEKIRTANAAMKNCSMPLAKAETINKIRIVKALIVQHETAKNLLIESETMLDEIIAELHDVPLFP